VKGQLYTDFFLVSKETQTKISKIRKKKIILMVSQRAFRNKGKLRFSKEIEGVKGGIPLLGKGDRHTFSVYISVSIAISNKSVSVEN